MLLLDTCTLLWLAGDQNRLSNRARELIAAHPGELFVSAISAFEIALKMSKGRLILPLPPELWFQKALQFHGIQVLAITWQIAARSAIIPPLHNDPCDRIIVANGIIHVCPILTPDPLIASHSGIQVDW